VAEARLRASNMVSNRHAPSFQRWKASRSSQARSPSRGCVQARVSVDSWKRGELQPFVNPESMTMGCSSNLGGGEPRATSSCGVRTRGRARSFAPGGSAHAAHCHRFNPSLAQPLVGSWRCPQAASRRAVSFGVPPFGELVAPDGECRWSRCGSLPAHPERDALSQAVLFERSGTGSEGKRGGCRVPKKGPAFTAGEDRTLGERARALLSLLQKSTGGV